MQRTGGQKGSRQGGGVSIAEQKTTTRQSRPAAAPRPQRTPPPPRSPSLPAASSRASSGEPSPARAEPRAGYGAREAPELAPSGNPRGLVLTVHPTETSLGKQAPSSDDAGPKRPRSRKATRRATAFLHSPGNADEFRRMASSRRRKLTVLVEHPGSDASAAMVTAGARVPATTAARLRRASSIELTEGSGVETRLPSGVSDGAGSPGPAMTARERIAPTEGATAKAGAAALGMSPGLPAAAASASSTPPSADGFLPARRLTGSRAPKVSGRRDVSAAGLPNPAGGAAGDGPKVSGTGRASSGESGKGGDPESGRESPRPLIANQSLPSPEAMARERRLLLPESSFKRWWDTCMLALALYLAVSVPYRIAFGGPGTDLLPLVINALISTAFLADMLLQFNTATKRHGELVFDRRVIAHDYLTSYFALDLLALLPVDDVVHTVADVERTPMLRLTRFLRLLRMVRGHRIIRTWEQASHVNPSALRLFKLFFVLLLLWHIVGCSYWFVAERENFGRDDIFFEREGDNFWVPAPELYCTSVGECPGQQTCFESGECPASDSTKYLDSLFWAVMVTTGVGRDLQPVTELEYIFTVALIVVGLIMQAVLIGSASSALSSLDSIDAERRGKLESIQQYMRLRRIPDALQKRVRQYYEYMWASHQSLAAGDEGIMADLHPSLKLELHISLNRRLLQEVPMFKMITDSECLIDIIEKLRPKIYIPGEFVVIESEIGEELFIIVRGRVHVLVGPELKFVAELSNSAVFGERALITRERRNASVRAVTYCDMMVLHKVDFDVVMANYPEFFLSIQRVAQQQYASGWMRIRETLRMAHAMRMFGSPTDLRHMLLGEASNEEEEPFHRTGTSLRARSFLDAAATAAAGRRQAQTQFGDGSSPPARSTGSLYPSQLHSAGASSGGAASGSTRLSNAHAWPSGGGWGQGSTVSGASPPDASPALQRRTSNREGTGPALAPGSAAPSRLSEHRHYHTAALANDDIRAILDRR